MKINFISYGYKYNHQVKTDILLDARCLINPYYQEELKNLTGLDSRVSSYILLDSYTMEYINSIILYLDTYIKRISNKRDEITVSVVCTGGKHRSVFLANYLFKHYQKSYECLITHIDINE